MTSNLRTIFAFLAALVSNAGESMGGDKATGRLMRATL